MPDTPVAAAGAAIEQVAAMKSDTAAPQISNDDPQRQAGVAKAIATTLGEIVSVLMRVPEHRNWTLSQIEEAVLPPLLSGNASVATAQSKSNGLAQPVSCVLWARVSDDLAQRLTREPALATTLNRDNCTSGDNVWITLAAGDRGVLERQIQTLMQKRWKTTSVKAVFRAPDGQVRMASINAA